MLIEQLIFIVIAFILFVLMFLRMIKNNDTSYIVILILEAIGISINFMEVLLAIKVNIFLKILKYLFAVILPVFIIALEKSDKRLIELIKISKAKIYLFFSNSKSAKNALIELISRYDQCYIAHKMLAEIYEQEGGMRKAIDEYVQAIDIDKKDYNSYYKVASLLNQLGKKDEAQEMLASLLQTKPEYYQATELLGDLLIENEKYKEAVNVYLDALKYNPTSYDLNYNIAIAYTMLNDFQSAKEYYEKAAELNSLLYNSKYSLAEIALIYKELEEAEKYFLEVVQEGNGDLEADSYFELAKINMIRGEKEKAINYANIALEIDPKKIAKKIKNEATFIPILSKLKIPFNLDNMQEKEITKLSSKDLKAKKHLEETVDITRNLSYSDILFLKTREKKESNEELKKEIIEEIHHEL